MPTIQQTSNQITRRLSILERQLKQKLQAFYTKHIKGSNAPIQTIRQRYGKEIEDLIRNNVQTAWLFANDIVADRTKTQINISVQDVQGIEKVSGEMTNQYWETSRKNLEREHEYKLEINTLEPAPQFALPAAMVGLSALMLYYAFNESMKSKTGLKLKFVVRSDCIDTKICLPLNGKLFDVGELVPPIPLHRHCHCRLIPISA